MSKILDTVVSYEEQLVDYVKKARKPVTDYVAKGVKLVETRLPEVTYPKSIATPIEVAESQAAFAKKLVDANTALVPSVLSRSEAHTSELQSLMLRPYAAVCLT